VDFRDTRLGVSIQPDHKLETKFLAIFGFWGDLLGAALPRNVVDLWKAFAKLDAGHNVCCSGGFH
jgi:hypothetical protein